MITLYQPVYLVSKHSKPTKHSMPTTKMKTTHHCTVYHYLQRFMLKQLGEKASTHRHGQQNDCFAFGSGD